MSLLVDKEEITEDDIPEIVRSEMISAFEDAEETEEIESESIDSAALYELICEMETELERRGGRFKGRAEYIRTLKEKQKQYASLTTNTQISWIMKDPVSVQNMKRNWLAARAAKELDYPIFFAVSEKSGKLSNGNPDYVIDPSTNLPKLDSHGHRMLNHDCDEIADAFIRFAKDQKFYFWGD